MNREIGGEFWLETMPDGGSMPDWLKTGDDYCLLLSGRTAIDFVLGDISTPVKSVYMASYCCESMLKPFEERNIQIEFYEVSCGKEGIQYTIDVERSCDVFFGISYFGFSGKAADLYMNIFKDKGSIVIEDITHRLLSDVPCFRNADYSIASLRKWFPVPSGGLAIKNNGKFKKQNLKKSSNFVEIKVDAMRKKADYINNYKGQGNLRSSDKHVFMNLFSRFNDKLKDNYKGYEIDEFSKRYLLNVDVPNVQEKRRDNARFLYKALKNHPFIDFMIPFVDFEKDCPLFMPVLVKRGLREALHKHLILSKIYSPVHWPVSCILPPNKNVRKIYDEELSLICDQRYDVADMQRSINAIEEFGESI